MMGSRCGRLGVLPCFRDRNKEPRACKQRTFPAAHRAADQKNSGFAKEMKSFCLHLCPTMLKDETSEQLGVEGLLKSPSDAEDVTQEIFSKVWGNRESFATVRNFGACPVRQRKG